MIIYLKKKPHRLFGKIKFYQNYITGSRDYSFSLVYHEKCIKYVDFVTSFYNQTQPYYRVIGLFTHRNVEGDSLAIIISVLVTKR